MLNIGPAELLIIGLVLLIAVGPEQLPSVIRRVGSTVAQFRSMTDGLRSEFMAGLDEIERATDNERWPDDDDKTSNVGRQTRERSTASDGDDRASDHDEDEGGADPASDPGPASDTEPRPEAGQVADTLFTDAPPVDDPVDDQSGDGAAGDAARASSGSSTNGSGQATAADQDVTRAGDSEEGTA